MVLFTELDMSSRVVWYVLQKFAFPTSCSGMKQYCNPFPHLPLMYRPPSSTTIEACHIANEMLRVMEIHVPSHFPTN